MHTEGAAHHYLCLSLDARQRRSASSYYLFGGSRIPFALYVDVYIGLQQVLLMCRHWLAPS